MLVLAAMSGGVDSAVAAARAVEAGHEVVGVHLALAKNPATGRTGARGCCTIEDAGDARRAADVIGIPFYVWDLADQFMASVMDDFVAEYAAGRTPNPCVRCNEKVKFAALLDKAVALGLRRRRHRALRARDDRPPTARRVSPAPRTRPRTSPTSSPWSGRTGSPGRCSRSGTPRRSRRSATRRRRRDSRRGQARQPRHLLHPGRGHPRLARRPHRATARRGARPGGGRRRHPRRRPGLHGRPAPRPAPGHPRGRRAAPVRARRVRRGQHGDRGAGACVAGRADRGRRTRSSGSARCRRRVTGWLPRYGRTARRCRWSSRRPGPTASRCGSRESLRAVAPGQTVALYDGAVVVGSGTVSACRGGWLTAAERGRPTVTRVSTDERRRQPDPDRHRHRLVAGHGPARGRPGPSSASSVRAPGLPYLPELPDRGPGADLTGPRRGAAGRPAGRPAALRMAAGRPTGP